MTTNLSCSACGLPLERPISTHVTGSGRVHYLRCVCGRWTISLDTGPIGAAGGSQLTGEHATAART